MLVFEGEQLIDRVRTIDKKSSPLSMQYVHFVSLFLRQQSKLQRCTLVTEKGSLKVI